MELREALDLLEAPIEEYKDKKITFGIDDFVEQTRKNFRRIIKVADTDKGGTNEQARNVLLAWNEFKLSCDHGYLKAFLDTGAIKKSETEVDGDWDQYDSAATTDWTTWSADTTEWYDDMNLEAHAMDDVVHGMGGFKEFLKAIPVGRHTVTFKGFRFKVEVTPDNLGGFDARIWRILYNSIHRIKLLGQQEPDMIGDPIRYLLAQ